MSPGRFSRPIQRPSVKSGTGTGMEPIATDYSLRQVIAIQLAASYTSMGKATPF